MSLGLERRLQVLKPYWTSHLQRSKDNQERWLAEELKQTDSEAPLLENLFLLGSGRLSDVPVESYRAAAKQIHLVDADIRALRQAKKALKNSEQFDLHQLEFTGRLSLWKAALKKSLATADYSQLPQLLKALEQLPHTPLLRAFVAPNSHAVSLNALSQIAVIWQDLLEALLIERWGREFVRERESDWLLLFARSAEFLVLQHLIELAALGLESLCIISDIEYLTYRSSSSKVTELPLIWESKPSAEFFSGAWVENPAMRDFKSSNFSFEAMPALYGLEVSKKQFWQAIFPSYEVEVLDIWPWHIQPLGVEKHARHYEQRSMRNSGTVHLVAAFSIRRMPR